MSIAASAQVPGTGSTRVIEGLFIHRDAIGRHLKSPMLRQREAYLALLLESGYKRRLVAEHASMLLNVVRFIAVPPLSFISEEAILDGAHRWFSHFQRDQGKSLRSGCCFFLSVARRWFRYLGIYARKTTLSHSTEQIYDEFERAMRHGLGYLPSTVDALTAPVRRFLGWVSAERLEICSIGLSEVDEYLLQGRAKGWQPRTVRVNCVALRAFFRLAERRGWNNNGLSRAIRAPSLQTRVAAPECPSWKQLRLLLAFLDDSNPSQCRAKAILLLASVYGLRRSEIVRLTLDDLDWFNEIITIRRSKRGRLQQFPLQFEVGEAIIRYLRNVRPSSKFRNLFITLHSPYRPAVNIGAAIRKILTAAGILDRTYGLHAFRHACATELLRKGTSLRGIADFLGHRDIRSVSIYAHSDCRALRKVAAFDLKGVL
jgi:integrase/recombinase XerD